MSSGPAYKSNDWSPRGSVASQKTDAHESREAFRPALRPGRRSAAAGLDTLDLTEQQDHTRRGAPRRRERLLTDNYESFRAERAGTRGV